MSLLISCCLGMTHMAVDNVSLSHPDLSARRAMQAVPTATQAPSRRPRLPIGACLPSRRRASTQLLPSATIAATAQPSCPLWIWQPPPASPFQQPGSLLTACRRRPAAP